MHKTEVIKKHMIEITKSHAIQAHGADPAPSLPFEGMPSHV
jgi:hypothetical protein